MRIRVEVKNNILGDSVFWEGDEKDCLEIGNYPARRLARLVAVDGKTHTLGMWVASKVKDSE